jgi:hypothetical protein
MEIAMALFYIVPAVLFYAWVVGFGWLALRPGSTVAARIAFGVLAALPVVWYASGFVTSRLDYQRQRAHIAGLAGVARPPNPPRIMAVYGKREPWQDELVEIGAFEAIYVNDYKTGRRDHGPWTRIAYARSARCLNAHTKDTSVMAMRRAQAAFVACAVDEQVPAAPTQGLTFYIGERWHLSLRGTFPSDLTPYELYWTRDGREDELVGYWEQAQGGWPLVPPVLTAFGFMQAEFRDVRNPKPSPQAFLLDRLALDADTVRPREAPGEAERRAQFGRLARSTDTRDRDIALRIATVTGDAFLTGDDIDGLLAQPEVTGDIVSRAGGLSFCVETGRLCAFADRLAAACRRSDAGAAACQRLDAACGTCGRPGGRR